MSDLSKILSVENEEDCEVASTPIRTVRALKNKYSSQTNIASRDDYTSEVIGSNNMSKSSVSSNLGLGFQQNQNTFKSQKNIAEDNADQQKAGLGIKPAQFQRKQLHSLTTTLPQRNGNRENENTHQFNALELPLEDHQPYAKTEFQIGRQMVSQNPAKEQLKTPQSSSRTDLSVLLPLNDKTNIQSEKNQFFRRFKKRVETMNEIPILKEQENQSRIQYQNIDVEYGIRLVMSKSKRLRDKIEKENISEQFLAKTIWQSKPFKIEYSMFLLQQVHLKVISPEFKNINKKAFDKLENFIIACIDRARHKETLHGDYLRCSNSVQSLFQKQIDELNAQLNNPNKISLDEEVICA